MLSVRLALLSGPGSACSPQPPPRRAPASTPHPQRTRGCSTCRWSSWACWRSPPSASGASRGCCRWLGGGLGALLLPRVALSMRGMYRRGAPTRQPRQPSMKCRKQEAQPAEADTKLLSLRYGSALQAGRGLGPPGSSSSWATDPRATPGAACGRWGSAWRLRFCVAWSTTSQPPETVRTLVPTVWRRTHGPRPAPACPETRVPQTLAGRLAAPTCRLTARLPHVPRPWQ